VVGGGDAELTTIFGGAPACSTVSSSLERAVAFTRPDMAAPEATLSSTATSAEGRVSWLIETAGPVAVAVAVPGAPSRPQPAKAKATLAVPQRWMIFRTSVVLLRLIPDPEPRETPAPSTVMRT
jgi:hypothetical protein